MEEIGLEWSWLADLTAHKLENKQLLSKLDLPGGDARFLFLPLIDYVFTFLMIIAKGVLI
jgi:hypothetical protein